MWLLSLSLACIPCQTLVLTTWIVSVLTLATHNTFERGTHKGTEGQRAWSLCPQPTNVKVRICLHLGTALCCQVPSFDPGLFPSPSSGSICDASPQPPGLARSYELGLRGCSKVPESLLPLTYHTPGQVDNRHESFIGSSGETWTLAITTRPL